jgi:DMSO/TMAO reductase YedYZ molybdopterin-dependent catalytic subunit
MTTVTLDRLLAALVVAMAGTGLLTLRAGTPASGWLYVAHGLLAGALVAAVALKVRRSVPRAAVAGRRARLLFGLLVTFVGAAALSGGYLWVASGEIVSVGSWTVLTLHAWVGLALVPLVVVHVIPRRWMLLRPARRRTAVPAGRADSVASGSRTRRVSRRTVVAGGLFGLAGVTGYAMAAAVERLRGGERRFTGSRFLPSGGVPPPTTFFGEPTPPVHPATWRLSVAGRVARPLDVDLAGLRALGERDAIAVLDCTSGWALETTWRGIPLPALLEAAGAESDARGVVIRSVTGWQASLSIAEAADCLLATDVAGAPLPDANGAPVRLVIPSRRGLDWVKWVSEVSVA